MVELVRHRQTKGGEQICPTYSHRATSRLYTIDAVGAVHPNTQSGDQIGLYLRRWRSGSAKATAALGMALALGW